MISSCTDRLRSRLRNATRAWTLRAARTSGTFRKSDSSRMCSVSGISVTPLRRSQRPDHVHEDAVALVAHIGQIFREIREVVPEPGLHVLAEVAVESNQHAGARLVEIR